MGQYIIVDLKIPQCKFFLNWMWTNIFRSFLRKLSWQYGSFEFVQMNKCSFDINIRFPKHVRKLIDYWETLETQNELSIDLVWIKEKENPLLYGGDFPTRFPRQTNSRKIMNPFSPLKHPERTSNLIEYTHTTSPNMYIRLALCSDPSARYKSTPPERSTFSKHFPFVHYFPKPERFWRGIFSAFSFIAASNRPFRRDLFIFIRENGHRVSRRAKFIPQMQSDALTCTYVCDNSSWKVSRRRYIPKRYLPDS